MQKILINILLLFVLGVTAVPMKQVGKLLHTNQLQQDANDDDDTAQDTSATVKFMAKEMLCLHDGHSFSFAFSVSIGLPTFCQFGHGPLLCPPVDIHCPPPNII